MTRTFEEAIKFDNGLTIGCSVVELTLNGNARRALVSIGPRGKVKILLRPGPDQMYSSWQEVKGNAYGPGRKDFPMVYPARHNPALMEQFDAEPVARIDLAPYVIGSKTILQRRVRP